MNTSEITPYPGEESPMLQARIAGASWWVCILTGLIGFILWSPIIVANDAAGTAANMLAKETLFRIGFVFNLLSGVSYMGVNVFMYYVLKPVRRSLSLLAAFFGLAGVAIGGVAWASYLVPLVLLHGDPYLSAFTTAQLQAMSMIALKLPTQTFFIGMVFFGIQCILIGYLVARSTFLPRILGVLLTIGGTCYVIGSLANFLSSLGARFIPFIMLVALIGEGSLGLWLLLKGVNKQRWLAQVNGRGE